MVEESLTSYRSVVDSIEGEFVLKTQAEELLFSVNQTFTEREGLAVDSVQVRMLTHTGMHTHTHNASTWMYYIHASKYTYLNKA